MTEHILQRRPRPTPIPSPKPAPAPKTVAPLVHHAAASGGGALDTKTQREMGSRFGYDFSQVRIHADTRAAESAQMLGANAYAVGSDIVFGEGRYAPGTRDGDHLIAHELTHVVQQASQGANGEDRLSRREDASEQEAETLATLVIEGQSVQVQARSQAAIAREGEGSDDPLENPYLKWGGKGLSFLPGPLGMIGKAIGVTENADAASSSKSMGEGIWNGVKGGIGMAGLVAKTGGFGLFGAEGVGAAASAVGGAFSAGGIGGVLGTIAPTFFGGATGAGVLPGVAGMEAFGAEGALAGAGLEGAAAMGPAAAVLGAGVAGVGAGIGLDKLVNSAGNYIAPKLGYDKGDYSISNGLSHLMTGADNAFTGMARATGAYDDSKPEYTQTVGMGLANLFTPTTDASGHEDSFTDRLGNLF